jgi:hypothetical protein
MRKGGARQKKKEHELRASVLIVTPTGLGGGGGDGGGAPPLEGWLQKKNRHGMWQKRFFRIHAVYLVYGKTPADAAEAPDAAIDLREIAQILPDASATNTKLLTLVMQQGIKVIEPSSSSSSNAVTHPRGEGRCWTGRGGRLSARRSGG